MDTHLVKSRWRPGQRASTREALPALMVLPLRSHADALLPRHQTEGMTRKIIESFARIPDLLVIAPSTALQYRSPIVEPLRLRAELGIDYALSMHVVRDDDRLTFTLDLYDASSNARMLRGAEPAHLDRLYDFEKNVVSRVVNRLLPSMREAEITRTFRKPTSNLTAYDCVMRALAELEVFEQPNIDQADSLLRRARALDPAFAPAFAWGARVASLRVGQGWTKDRQATAKTAEALAARAIELDPEDAVALATAGHLKSFLFQDYEAGLRLIERALVACPNSSLAWSLASPTLNYIGRAREGLAHAQHAIWLSPIDSFAFQSTSFAGMSCYLLGEYDAAISWLRLSLADNPNYTSTLKGLIAANVGLSQVSEARALRDRLLDLEPDFGTEGTIRSPFRDPVSRALFRTQMRTAGIGEARGRP